MTTGHAHMLPDLADSTDQTLDLETPAAQEAAFTEALSAALDAPSETPDAKPEALEASETPDGTPDAPEAVKDPAPLKEDPARSDAAKPDTPDEDEELTDEDFETATKGQLDRRTRQAIRQRAKFKQEAEGLRAERDAMAQALGLQDSSALTTEYLGQQARAAAGFRDLEDFMGKAQLAPTDVQVGLQAMASITAGDWPGFMKIVQPYLDIAQGALGGGLPADLQQQVDRGEISEAFAKQHAEMRAGRSAAEIRAQRSTARVQYETQQRQQDTAQQSQTAAAQIRAEVNRWQQEIARSDPDFGRKESLIQDRLVSRMAREGQPRDAATALAWTKEAHAYVTDLLRPAQPATPSRSSTPAAQPAAPSPNNVQPKAETLEQVLENALAQGVR